MIALLMNVLKEFTQFGVWVHSLWDERVRCFVVGLVLGHTRSDSIPGFDFPAFLLRTADKEKPSQYFL